MQKKINLALLFGGKSIEHEVSLQSARTVLGELDREKYYPLLIGISKNGQWHLYEEANAFENPDDPLAIRLGKPKEAVALLPHSQFLVSLDDHNRLIPTDVVFPILHGLLGEDGTVQGLLTLAAIPFVGAGTLGGAVGMDKDVMKRLLNGSGIPTARFITIPCYEKSNWTYSQIASKLGHKLFVKPASGGSSIGITRVDSAEPFSQALETAFLYDKKVVVEEAIDGREVQCSLTGNQEVRMAEPCEIVPRDGVHSYAAKYVDKGSSQFFYPAPLNDLQREQVENLAIKTYRALECEGFARVDLFLKSSGEVICNEINTIPGLALLSPYAKMWKQSGVSYAELIDELIECAFARHRSLQKLVTTYDPAHSHEEICLRK